MGYSPDNWERLHWVWGGVKLGYPADNWGGYMGSGEASRWAIKKVIREVTLG